MTAPSPLTSCPVLIEDGTSASAVAAQRQNDRPVALFVLGMARSGTSALTRVLSLCGGALPSGLIGATPANPRGFWEPRALQALNESILRRHGSAVFDPSLRLREEGAVDAEKRAASLADISTYLHALPPSPLTVIKEIRITVLSELWFEAAKAAGYDVVTVIAVRHPDEVNASVVANSPISEGLSGALWLKASLLAERETRDVPRVFVEYTSLLRDWRHEIRRISNALEIDLYEKNADEIDEFLSSDLRRQRSVVPVAEPFGTDWLSVVYRTFTAAAGDEQWDTDTLDRIYEQYRASENGFRTAFDDYRRLRGSILFRPALMKLALGALAIANRRKGTWA